MTTIFSQARTLESNVFTTKTLPIEYAEFAVLGEDTAEKIESLASTSIDSAMPQEEIQSKNETEMECEAIKREEESVTNDHKVTESLQLQDEECTIFDVFNALKRFIQGSISVDSII